MTIAVNPELAVALARIAELEAEIAHGDAADRINNAHADELEEGLEALEEEIVGERANALKWERMYHEAEEHTAKVREDLAVAHAEMLQRAEDAHDAELDKKDEDLKEAETSHAVALEELGDILRDYLVCTYGHSSGSLPRDLKRLCDAAGVNW